LNVEISSAEQVVIVSSVAIGVVCCPAGNHSSTQKLLRMEYCRASDVTGHSAAVQLQAGSAFFWTQLYYLFVVYFMMLCLRLCIDEL
jgi:hypothetical protein